MNKLLNEDLLPALRFPAFKDAGKWERKTLGKHIKQYTEKVSSRTKWAVYSSTREGLKKQTDYYDGRILANEGEYGVVPDGYFVYRHMSDDNTFKFNINNSGQKIVVSKEYPVFRAVTMSSEFLRNLLNEGREFKNFAIRQKKGGTRTRLYFKTLRNFEPLMPSLDEQEKIADCLVSIDDLVTAQTRKLDAIRAYKKGMMQQLFPAEDETTPKLRFPVFREAGEWESKLLSELLREAKHRNRKLEYGRQDVLSVSGEYGCVNQIEFKGRSYAGASVKDYHVVEKGDIVYTKSPLKNNPFGIIKENKGRTGIVSTLYAVYRVTGLAHAAYLDQYFTREFHVNSYLQPIVNKGAKNDMKVNNADVLSGKICVPKIEEQQKIADFLLSIDRLIKDQIQIVEGLKAHKKGLTQQLFPAVD